MNKNELINNYKEFLARHNLKAEQVVVGAGGALLMLGLREETNDIDVDVDYPIFQELEKRYPCSFFDKVKILECKEFSIDVHEKIINDTTDIINGVCVYSLESVLKFKLKLNRDKDKQDIFNIKQRLNI